MANCFNKMKSIYTHRLRSLTNDTSNALYLTLVHMTKMFMTDSKFFQSFTWSISIKFITFSNFRTINEAGKTNLFQNIYQDDIGAIGANHNEFNRSFWTSSSHFRQKSQISRPKLMPRGPNNYIYIFKKLCPDFSQTISAVI